MKLICSWCKKYLGEKEPFDDQRISHTICDECSKEYFKGKKFVKNPIEKLTQDEVAKVLASTSRAIGGKRLYYVGRKKEKKTKQKPWLEWLLFLLVSLPTEQSHGKQFVYVLGPFESERKAVDGFFHHHIGTHLKSVLRKGKKIVATYGINE